MARTWIKHSLACLFCLAMIAGCSSKTNEAFTKEQTETAIKDDAEEKIVYKIRISFDDQEMIAEFEDNITSRALIDQMPFTISMMNLYGREMCYRFGRDSLPIEGANDSTYSVGDISIWPPAGSLVILYKQNGEIFEQQYLGHTDDDLSIFEGLPDADMTFELIE
ncbi:MAG: hypothetical protein IJI66_16475 [Erysipelotrichaceae bacterium]|nr:hypothetical protein [Erysipelotrichaceae bacterium]